MNDQGLKHYTSNLVDQVGVIDSTYSSMTSSSCFNLEDLGIIDSSKLLNSTTYTSAYKYFSCDELIVPAHQSSLSKYYRYKNNNYSDITIPYNAEIILDPSESVYFYITYKANRSKSPMILYDSVNSIEGPSLNVPDVPDVSASLSHDNNLYKLILSNRGSVQRRFRLNTGKLLLRIDNSYFPFVNPNSIVIPYRGKYVDPSTWGDYRFVPYYDNQLEVNYSGINVSLDEGNSILLELCAGGGGGAQNYAWDSAGAAGGGAGGYMCIYIQRISSSNFKTLKITVGKAGASESYSDNSDPTQGEHTSLDIIVNNRSFRLFTCEGGFNASAVREDNRNTFQKGGVGGRVAYGNIVYPSASNYEDNNTWAYNEGKNTNKPSNNSLFPREGCILYNRSSKTIRIITSSMNKVDRYEVPILRFKVVSVIYGGSGGSYMTRGNLRSYNYLYINANSPYSSGQPAATNGSFAGCRLVQAGSVNYTWGTNETGFSYNNSINNYNILYDTSGTSSDQINGTTYSRASGSTQYLFNDGDRNKCYCAGGGASALSYVTYVPYSSSGIYQLNEGNNSQSNYEKYVCSNGYGYGGGGGCYSRKGTAYRKITSEPGSGVAIIHYPGSRFSFEKLEKPSGIHIEEFQGNK